MNRRTFAATAFGSLLAPLIVKGQARGATYRLGILALNRAPVSDPVLAETFTLPLREMGYVEGKNITIVRRYADGDAARLPGLARELAGLRVDVILAIGSSAIAAAKAATETIPIVLFTNGDPVRAGFVSSLARPGANVTGVLIAPEGSLAGKRLELLRDMVPGVARVALLITGDPGTMVQQQVEETQTAASQLGLQLRVTEVIEGDYARAFAAMALSRPHALLVGAQAIHVRDRKQIIELAAKYRLPASYEWPRQVRDGGLMSYGASDVVTYRQVASYIDRILKGAKPADLSIWQPSSVHLVINLKTAKALGLTIPPAVMLRADELIE